MIWRTFQNGQRDFGILRIQSSRRGVYWMWKISAGSKVIFFGLCLQKRWVSGTYTSDYVQTLGADLYVKNDNVGYAIAMTESLFHKPENTPRFNYGRVRDTKDIERS